MQIKDLIKKLQSSKEFKNHIKQNKDSYLCAFFQMQNPQLDYYNKKTRKITSFTINNKITSKTTDKIFQKEKKDIKELKVNEIKISLDKALKKTEQILEKNKIKIIKKIIILQKIKIPFWNISYITQDFKILNIKINAVNGNIIEEKLESVIGFKK